ncbi:MAG: hypothetical protein M1836_007219 [Candelina mexicana]|nr:MAG: hypothetical protein M1836_007219 [Candelina mexicana]
MPRRSKKAESRIRAIKRAEDAAPAGLPKNQIHPEKRYKAFVLKTADAMSKVRGGPKPTRTNLEAQYRAHLVAISLTNELVLLNHSTYDQFWSTTMRNCFTLKGQDVIRAGQAAPKRRRTKRRLHADGKPYDVNEKA